ncbi:SDR family NAD(P)-dependent oxidoreductase [Actinophytocola oryzae]|uniref:NAD(P)-dependent dehydrogenase (Short-subunit alcohol dehydrogenase family) n=1 Tax=Actinophytocola oryzae TaxID=502181 RepID=A0A4R7W0L3_9PSEU|nr:SDR family oxidoreductase [Actinophytocola oryzae]TDV56050.1 NAD(P)-dependent dehydrogenase (short-subunit alcohol dehydrogenase family) [Actinophytocola oryzae]
MTTSLAHRVAVVTGASSGIGAATALALSAAGARVALLARGSAALAGVASTLPGESLPVPTDVADDAQVAAAMDRVVARWGVPDLVVTSAGVSHPAPLSGLTPELWRETVDVNLSGTFYVAREAGLRMRAVGVTGDIVTVGSELSVIGMASYVAYCAAKAGVLGLTRALAAELAPLVRVNAVCPGPVDTPMLAAEFAAEGDASTARAETVARVPLGRLATADEVAAAVCYLVAPTTYATGTVLNLDGGTTCV